MQPGVVHVKTNHSSQEPDLSVETGDATNAEHTTACTLRSNERMVQGWQRG
jgi:hypothetical protein